ncbi:MAG: hypothetical protein ACXV8S_14550, partial [Methylobacter sp.]
MSDFLKSLSARSFGFADGSGNVRPRLPSLYETPQGSLGKQSNQVLKASIASPEADTLQNEVTSHSDQNLQVTENSKTRPKTAQAVSAWSSNDFGEKPDTVSASDRLTNSAQMILPAKKQNFRAEPGMAFGVNNENKPSPVTPNEENSLSKKLTDGKSAGTFTLETTKAGIEADNKAVFSSHHLDEDVSNAHLNAEQPMKKQPSKLMTDASVLERMGMEKTALHAKAHPDTGGSSGKAPAEKKENWLLADLSQFHAKWSAVKPVLREPANRIASSGYDPAPTIQVTIGRIEIRATQPAKATSKNVDKKPSSMSLEEYLAKRNGGMR